MNIDIPKKLDLSNSLKFCETLKRIDGENINIYNYDDMSTVEPFGMLIVGSKIRNINNIIEHSEINFENKSYAANMGFFHSVNCNFGKSPEVLIGNGNFMPIKKINIRESYKKAFDKGIDIYSYIEKEIATKLANVLVRNEEGIKKGVIYCITEVLRNIYEHSNTKELWYAGQYWPQKDLVEIAILDEGIGILETLKRNKKLKISDEYEAINLALMPGISKRLGDTRVNDIYSNRGFGLYMLKSICDEVGNFAICSKNLCVVSSKNGIRKINTSFDGTAIRIRFKASKIPQIGSLIVEIRKEGEKISEKYSKLNSISIDSRVVLIFVLQLL